jgi:hypothetical protein
MTAVRRTSHRLERDSSRVIAKPYLPGEEIAPGVGTRAGLLMARILAIPEDEVTVVLAETLALFRGRHRGLEQLLERHFALVAHHAGDAPLSRERRLLIGAYFTNEYSIEGAALFNPSIVPAPDQSGTRPGEQRFVMSLRAVGEGHISSIEFRTGLIDAASNVSFDPLGPVLVTGSRTPPAHYHKAKFAPKLTELDAGNDLAWSVLDRLPERFTLAELEQSLETLEREGPPHAISFETAKIMRVLAASSYIASFPEDSSLSERILFPAGPHETHGMEDARFVRFTDDDGCATYYATYTAFDGYEIVPQLIQTDDMSPSGSRRSTARPLRTRAWPCSRAGFAANTSCCPASIARIFTWRRRRTSVAGPTYPICIGRSGLGSSCRSATAARPLKPRKAGWSSPMASAPCGGTRSEPCCSTWRIPIA